MTELPAGDFATWVRAVTDAWESGTDVDVPCGACDACCRSALFVHVGPEETATLARIPKALRFPAPGRPAGWVVLPHDERGRCAMLGEHGCTIYEHRPLTCRHFDCRVYVAAGIEPPTSAIAERTRQWRFDAETDDVRAIAVDLRDASATDRAARAVSLSTIGLRDATDGDAEWLYDLHEAAMRERVEQVYGPWDDDQQRRLFADRDPAEQVLVITKHGSRVGTVRVRELDDELEITLLEVAPEHRSRGIGTEVLRRLRERHRR